MKEELSFFFFFIYMNCRRT